MLSAAGVRAALRGGAIDSIAAVVVNAIAGVVGVASPAT